MLQPNCQTCTPAEFRACGGYRKKTEVEEAEKPKTAETEKPKPVTEKKPTFRDERSLTL